ncbi:MAG: GNAT family N-acetyltransferase [Elainella sp.]
MATLTITARAYQGETDLQPIADLLNECEHTDQEDSYYSASDLALGYAEPGFDPHQNVWLWERVGRLVAYADLGIPAPEAIDTSIDCFLWFRVHPDERWQGLETEILAWAEQRLLAEVKHLATAGAAVETLPIQLTVGCRDHQVERIAFYESQGFVYERCFLTMTCRLDNPVPNPVLPDGYRIVQSRGAEDAAAWIEMYNQTFIDHWRFHPALLEEHLYWLSTPVYSPELDLVATAPDGSFAAFCLGYIDREFNQQKHRREGWIGSLGTRRGFRRQGLARAMLLAGLQKLQAAGMDTAKLAVDTQNPNAAQTLYESVGFRKLHAQFSYTRQLRLT